MMIARSVMLALALFGFGAAAEPSQFNFGDECELSLSYDIELERDRLEVSDAGETLYRIQGDQLWVRGKSIDLNASQRALVRDYHAEMERQLPEVVELVDDALTLVGNTLDTVFTELSDFGLDPSQGTDVMARIQDKVNASMRTENGGIRLSANAMDNFSDELDQTLETEIESVISASMGGMLMALGQAMSEGDSGDFEQRMEDFGTRMERMGERIETEMEAQATALEQRANAMCGEWQQLDLLEQKMQRQIPELAEFDLVVQGDPDLAMLR
ncbi:YggN family protein [Ferrimonas balearica]|uniref:YggN family protein n=1 Tax=Ferrimonas balearica TaxID=44012 RepID=UPI001C940BA3|nr:YggN family protein [Ferrimonas balearica]MBY6107042.1 YggN family protein [Ferrimonas balearica]